MNTIFERISIRDYTDRAIEDEKVEMLMKAAMAAPSAGNQQPWEFYVVTDKTKLQQMAKCSPYAGCTERAPLAIVACYRKDIRMPEYAEIDMSACTENILLEAEALGLGAVWLGIAPLRERMDKVKDILCVPTELEVFAIIPCGYPKDHAKQQNRYEKERVHYIK